MRNPRRVCIDRNVVVLVMLKHIKATYACDSCGKEKDWIIGNGFTGCWNDLDSILDCIKFSMISGWVRAEPDCIQGKQPCPLHWCDACHMKKPIGDKNET